MLYFRGGFNEELNNSGDYYTTKSPVKNPKDMFIKAIEITDKHIQNFGRDIYSYGKKGSINLRIGDYVTSTGNCIKEETFQKHYQRATPQMIEDLKKIESEFKNNRQSKIKHTNTIPKKTQDPRIEKRNTKPQTPTQ